MAAPVRQIFSMNLSRIISGKGIVTHSKHFSAVHSKNSDIRKLFINGKVQSILKKITGFDLNRINAPQLMDLQESQVKLLTDEQLGEVEEQAQKEAGAKLMMPPVMDPRKEINEVLSVDPEIAEAVDDKIIFTDITFGIPDRERIIVVRETDGTLRAAGWSERERMQQIYFPRDEKKLRMPKMFLDENLQLVLDEERYFYALERACLQFEPDDSEFIRVTKTVYDHILKHKHFDTLRSTRHFGPMTFYYARNKLLDQVLIYFLRQNEVDCAAATVKLLHILHPDLESAMTATEKSISESGELLELYCELDAHEKGPVSLLLQSQVKQQAEG